MEWLRKFMTGRAGTDQLNLALIIFGLVLSFVPVGAVKIISLAFPALALFRMFSKNVAKRRTENAKFCAIWYPLYYKLMNLFRKPKSDSNFLIFKCKNCAQSLRVPKGKGKMVVTCPKCGTKVEKST